MTARSIQTPGGRTVTVHHADAAIGSLLEVWDTAARGVAALGAGDWRRPVDDGVPGSDVTGLVTHLAGIHYAGPDRLREAVDVARTRAAIRLRATAPSRRVVGGHCLDMCLHAYDLTTALGLPFDLDACEPATLEACRVLVGFVPRLLVAAGAPDATVRLLVRSAPDRAPTVDHTVRVRDGHPRVGPSTAGADTVDVTAAGLLLMITGRRDPDRLAADGLAGWSGEAAERFVHRTRPARA